MFFFFFSSRRRHTRLQGDWSSDVCSSDLNLLHALAVVAAVGLHLEQLPEAEDRIEGRAQIVAHAREEIALRAVGAIRLRLGLRQLVGPLAHALLELLGIPLHLLG